MRKCYICKTGNLKNHGSFGYCDSCNYEEFIMSDDYFASAAVVLGTLLSNTKFSTFDSLAERIYHTVDTHLPVLASYTRTLTPEANAALSVAITREALTHALNVELPDDTPEELLVDVSASKEVNYNECAGCGKESLVPTIVTSDKESLYVCSSCGVQHVKVHSSGETFPAFRCDNCSGIRCESIDASDLLVACTNCSTAHMKLFEGLKYTKA